MKAILARLNRIPSIPLLVLLICSLSLSGVFYARMNDRIQIMPAATPLAAPDTSLSAGDTVVIRVHAPMVTDMYGYQFKLNYDESTLAYESLSSSVDGIDTIFQKAFDGYLLVGATKIGEAEGYTGVGPSICEIEMNVLKDGPLSDVSLSEVNVVDSDMGYAEGIEGWDYEVLV